MWPPEGGKPPREIEAAGSLGLAFEEWHTLGTVNLGGGVGEVKWGPVDALPDAKRLPPARGGVYEVGIERAGGSVAAVALGSSGGKLRETISRLWKDADGWIADRCARLPAGQLRLAVRWALVDGRASQQEMERLLSVLDYAWQDRSRADFTAWTTLARHWCPSRTTRFADTCFPTRPSVRQLVMPCRSDPFPSAQGKFECAISCVVFLGCP